MGAVSLWAVFWVTPPHRPTSLEGFLLLGFAASLLQGPLCTPVRICQYERYRRRPTLQGLRLSWPCHSCVRLTPVLPLTLAHAGVTHLGGRIGQQAGKLRAATDHRHGIVRQGPPLQGVGERKSSVWVTQVKGYPSSFCTCSGSHLDLRSRLALLPPSFGQKGFVRAPWGSTPLRLISPLPFQPYSDP